MTDAQTPRVSLGTPVKYLDRTFKVIGIKKDANNRIRVRLRDVDNGNKITIDGEILEKLV